MTTATKERGILMHARSVANILAGRKTQTRRIVKPQPTWIENSARWRWPLPKRACFPRCCTEVVTASREWWEYAPKEAFPWQPGDRLYVREAWATLKEYDDLPPREVPRMADIWYAQDASTSGDRVVAGRTRSSLHMPRWASRITLEITDVRVERVQDISVDDIKAEGVGGDVVVSAERAAKMGTTETEFDHRVRWQELWDDTNGKGAWDRNDWVWVVEFKVVA